MMDGGRRDRAHGVVKGRAADSNAVRGRTPVAGDRPELGWPPAAMAVVAVVAIVLPRPFDQAQGLDIAAAWLGIAGVVASFIMFASPRRVGTIGRLTWSWGGLLGWLAICGVASGRLWASLVGEPTNMLGLLSLIAFTAVVMAAGRYSVPVRHLLTEYGWIVVLLESVLALGQRFGQGEALAAGTLSNSTNMGVIFVLLLPWAFTRDSVRNRRDMSVRISTAVIALGALVATEARVAALVGFAWFAWVMARRLGSSLSRSMRYLTVAAAAIAVTVTVLALGSEAGALWRSVLGERPGIYLQTVRAVAERPLVGWGPDGLLAGGAATSLPEQVVDGRMVLFRFGSVDPHNIVLWFAVSGGLFAVALFVWALVEIVVRVRGIASSGVDPAPGLWAIVGTLLVGLTAPLVVHVLPLLAVVVGAALRGTPPTADGSSVRGGERAATVVAVSFALAGLLLAGNAGTRAMFEVASADRSPRMVVGSTRASDLWAGDAHLAYLASLHIGWASMVPGSPFAGSEADLDATGRAIALDSRNPIYALEHARTVRYHERPAADVDAAFNEVFARYPLFPLGHAEYAAYLAGSGRLEEAQEHLEIATLVEDRHPETVNAVQAVTEALEGAEAVQP